MFFKPKSNLPDSEKARIEFHFQQIAECIGFDRLRLPVLRRQAVLQRFESDQNALPMVRFIADHLDHDVSQLQVHVVPTQPASCSSGGG